MAVIKRRKLGIFPGYFQLLSKESRRKIEPKGTPSCLTPPPPPPTHLIYLATSNLGDNPTYSSYLQSWTKLLEKVFSIMFTFLRNKTISKRRPLHKENPFPQFNVACHKCPGIRLSFEYTTTLLTGEGREGRTGTATMFRKMLPKYALFSTVLSKIVPEVLLAIIQSSSNT